MSGKLWQTKCQCCAFNTAVCAPASGQERLYRTKMTTLELLWDSDQVSLLLYSCVMLCCPVVSFNMSQSPIGVSSVMTGWNNWTKKLLRFVTLHQHALNLALKRELSDFPAEKLASSSKSCRRFQEMLESYWVCVAAAFIGIFWLYDNQWIKKKLRPSPCYRQWFEYLCVADSWLILHLKGRPGSSPSGFLPEMLAFGHLLLLTVALWPYGRAEPECDEPVSATSSALLQQGTQCFYFKQPGVQPWRNPLHPCTGGLLRNHNKMNHHKYQRACIHDSSLASTNQLDTAGESRAPAKSSPAGIEPWSMSSNCLKHSKVTAPRNPQPAKQQSTAQHNTAQHKQKAKKLYTIQCNIIHRNEKYQ